MCIVPWTEKAILTGFLPYGDADNAGVGLQIVGWSSASYVIENREYQRFLSQKFPVAGEDLTSMSCNMPQSAKYVMD